MTDFGSAVDNSQAADASVGDQNIRAAADYGHRYLTGPCLVEKRNQVAVAWVLGDVEVIGRTTEPGGGVPSQCLSPGQVVYGKRIRPFCLTHSSLPRYKSAI